MERTAAIAILVAAAHTLGLCQTTQSIHSFSNGAGTLQNSSYHLQGTLGQAATGVMSSASFKLQAGFQPAAIIDHAPDLDFTSVEINPGSVVRGNSINAFFVLANTGTAKIESDIVVNGYLSANPTYDAGDREILGAVVVGDLLQPGAVIDESAGISITIPADVVAGVYYVILVADPSAAIEEKNETNNSIFASLSVTTQNDITPPQIETITPGAFQNGATISLSVTDDEGVKSVMFFHRQVSGGAFDSTAVTATGASYAAIMEESWADEMGMEGYFVAEDIAFNKTSVPKANYFWYRTPDAAKAIPFGPGLNGKTSTYQMFSLPYKPDDDAIADIFEIGLKGYDPVNWRMFHYSNGKYTEYPQEFRKIGQGEAYWFNTVIKDFEVKPGSGKMHDAAKGNFFLALAAGWNQVGNPYPFNISWSAVIGTNEKVGSLNFFSNGGYTQSDVFKPWTGAFVHADEAMTLPVPVTSRTTASGRTTGVGLTPDPDSEAWRLPITLRIGDVQETGGIGMHPGASASKDKYDDITVPRFLDYAEMSTWHEDFFSHQFSTDVVPTSEQQAWTFDIKSNLNDQPGEVTWDNVAIASEKSSLILIDLLEGNWVNMKTVGVYSFTHRQGRQLRIIYNREGEIIPGITLLGEAYPNPFASEVTIPILVDKPGSQQLEIYDNFGRLIHTLRAQFDVAGIQRIRWDGRDSKGRETSNGMLYYRLLDDHAYRMKRLIKR